MPEFYEPSVLKRLQETELSILKDFVAICEANGLEYYGIAGTGIGAIRHGGFIPWDDDIDIAMPRKDFEKMVSVVEREYKDRYYIVNAWRDKRYPLMTTRLAKRGTLFVENALKDAHCPCGIFLDLYVLDNVADNRILYELQSWEACADDTLLESIAVSLDIVLGHGTVKEKYRQVLNCLKTMEHFETNRFR